MFFAGQTARGQILGSTARQTTSGSLKFVAYYQGVKDQTLNFSVNGGGSCSSANAVAFSCGGASDVEAKGSGSAAMMKIIWQPWERFQYYGMFGVGSYSLSAPSSTVTNILTGDKLGQMYGVGMKASIVPDTIVAADGFPTPAIALDANVLRSQYSLSRVYPNLSATGNPNIDERLVLMTYQFAVEASHLFNLNEHWKLEPYGGLKWSRVQADLKDLTDGGHSGGKQDTASPFVGLRVPVEDHEAFFAEASFIDGIHYGAGLELRFK